MSIIASAGGLEIHPHDRKAYGAAKFCGEETCEKWASICVGGMPLCKKHAAKTHAAAMDKALQRAYWAADQRVMV